MLGVESTAHTFGVGIVDKGKIIDGSKAAPKDILIGLPSSGLHSNGYSLARAVLGKTELRKYSEELLRPTVRPCG